MEKCCFVTGHRPQRFHFSEHDPRCKKIKDVIEREIKRPYDRNDLQLCGIEKQLPVTTISPDISSGCC